MRRVAWYLLAHAVALPVLAGPMDAAPRFRGKSPQEWAEELRVEPVSPETFRSDDLPAMLAQMEKIGRHLSAVEQLTKGGSAALEVLIELTRHEDPLVSGTSPSVILTILRGDPRAGLEILRDGPAAVQDIMAAMYTCDEFAVAVPAGLASYALQSNSRAMRCMGLRAAGAKPGFEAQLQAALPAALNSDDWRIRTEAVLAALRTGIGSRGARAVLSDLLESTEPDARIGALRTLTTLQEPAKDLGDAARRALTGDNPAVRRAAVEALWKIGGDISEVLPALAEMLRQPGAQRFAADAITTIGAPCLPLLPQLTDLLASDDAAAAFACAWAIGKIGPDSIPHLEKASKDPRPLVRRRVIISIQLMGRSCAAGRAILLRGMNDPDGRVRCAAELALASSKEPRTAPDGK